MNINGINGNQKSEDESEFEFKHILLDKERNLKLK
jgi:hypothetical protein